jgi:NTE family protein
MSRWGLVLGGGGVLGAAWMTGALSALQRVHGVDPGEADVILGTSAGSVVAALLGAGISVDELCARQLDEPVTTGPLAGLQVEADPGSEPAHPPRPRWRPGSPALVVSNAGRLRRLPPTAVLSGFLPEGRGSLVQIGGLVAALHHGGWSPHPGVRVVALDYDTGRRVVFGAPQAPPATIAEAVMASCAIPGWYSPVVIGGRRYIDGGAWSATNVDLVSREQLDRLFVVAPMVSFALDRPTGWPARLERRWRERVTRRCLREVARVHEAGCEVTVIGPGPSDLQAMGANLMDGERRKLVLQRSLETSMQALAAPDPLGRPPLGETG